MSVKTKIKDEILEQFRTISHEASGQQIAAKLGVSRNAVWKAIGELRDEGFLIEGTSGRGYKLCGEKYMSESLMRKYLKRELPITLLKSTASTSDLAKAAAEDGAPEGSVFIAETQLSGRGRTGKSFYSPPGTGIYMSMVLRPSMPATEALKITTCAAVAVSEAIEEVTGKRASIKWVNDLFYNNLKICGILTEASFNMENGGLNYAVLGIGINVLAPKDGFGELSHIAGALMPYSENAGEIRSRLAAAICDTFLKKYTQMNSTELFEGYRRRLFVFGKKVSVINGANIRSATVLGIEKDYKLIVRYENGEVESLSSGEISIIPE